MSSQKVTTKQWEKFSNQISFSKQAVQQLSKLYIIIHEKVKSSIKNAVVNPNKNFCQQARHHIQFIKNVLQKIKDTQKDQYLVRIEKDMLGKYQKNLLGLLNQIQIMFQIQQSKLSLNLSSLKGFQSQKRQKHDLKSQVVESSKRIVRAKSGYKNRNDQKQIKIKIKNLSQRQQEENINLFFPTGMDNLQNKNTNNLQIQNENQLAKAFQQRRQALQNKIQNSMSKTSNGLGISFQKKYESNYLQMYFNERKQFADLIFNQQVYDQIILKNQSPQKILQNSSLNSSFQQNGSIQKALKMQEINSKIFPQFQIKTKFLKPVVKSKISNLITQIKKQLLKEYFEKNVQTLKAVNEIQKAKISSRQKMAIPMLSHRSHSLSNIQKGSQLKSIYESLNIKNKNKANNKQFGGTEYMNEENNSIKRNKSQSYREFNKKQIFNGMRSKRTFINSHQKPFYQTDKWNQKIQKKFQTKIINKFLSAKI